MQSLSSMLSPLKSDGSNNDGGESHTHNRVMDLQTPLSITIPPNDYEMAGTQTVVNDPCQTFGGNPLWPITYNQQPLLASKNPEMDALTKLNAELGNQYTYQMFEMEGASNSNYHNGFQNDPRLGYDKIVYTTSKAVPYKDLYYQCAYGQPSNERMAIRHKLDEDDVGPEAKRHCVGESRFGNERSVIVPNTSFIGNSSNAREG
uniref:Astacin domain-containing protein n=1 Tax=Caenorhabditis tropicalis TaxID=1561998 RepID=A0A1I7TB23_9PELO